MAKFNLPTPTLTSTQTRPVVQPTNLASEWRCLECGKLLGIRRGGRLHIRIAGHDYSVNLPAEACCRNCGTTNRT